MQAVDGYIAKVLAIFSGKLVSENDDADFQNSKILETYRINTNPTGEHSLIGDVVKQKKIFLNELHKRRGSQIDGDARDVTALVEDSNQNNKCQRRKENDFWGRSCWNS